MIDWKKAYSTWWAVAVLAGCTLAGPLAQSRHAESAYLTTAPVNVPTETNAATPLGIRYWSSTPGPADASRIDATYSAVVSCLLGTENVMPADAGCYSRAELRVPKTSNFIVRVAGPGEWRQGQTGWQVLNVRAPGSGCLAKGQAPTEEHYCSWRSMYRRVAGTDVYYTTPDMRMLSDAMVRHMTGCTNPWVPGLSECAAWSTKPWSPAVTKP